MIAEYILDNADICRCLINNRASADFIEKLQSLIFKNCADIIKRRYNLASNKSYDYYFSFITYGIIGLMKKWLDITPMAPVDEVVVLADKVITASGTALKQ